MKNQPDWLDEQTIILPDGTSVVRSYDREEDMLEIFFGDAPATATLELAEGVYLRFDRQQYEPLSLALMAFQVRMKQQEFGEPLVIFDGLARLQDPERRRVLQMLKRPPLTYVLHLYSFKLTDQTQTMPVASMEPMAVAV